VKGFELCKEERKFPKKNNKNFKKLLPAFIFFSRDGNQFLRKMFVMIDICNMLLRRSDSEGASQKIATRGKA